MKAEKPGEETPSLELHGVTQLPENTNCLACSEDGLYLCLGHSQGLSVWCASSLSCVAEWLQDRLEITSIQMTIMTETTYLLGSVDDMGVARVFAHQSDVIYLLCVINIMEDINKRSIFLTFELSGGGHYGAASVSCNGVFWLEVYQFPSAAWLKELEIVQSQKQDPDSPGDVDLKWSPLTMIIKTKLPKIAAGRASFGPPENSQTDYLTHCLALDTIRSNSCQSEKTSFNRDSGNTKETNQSQRRCTPHFLLPCGQFPDDHRETFQPDVEPMPDVVWPNAKGILCSAVSRCTRYIALGLDDALVCVWDRQSGAPLSVVLVPAANGPFLSVQLVDYWPVTAAELHISTAEKIYLLVLCKSGEIHTITTGRRTQSCTMQLTQRLKDSRDITTITTSVPFLQGLSLVVQRNGKMFVQDVINKTTVCFLTPPAGHLIAAPCNPVYALNTKQQTLFIRGEQDSSCSSSSEEDSQSQLFSFCFAESDLMKRYVASQQHQTLVPVPPEETCSLYLQQRALSVDERNKAVRQTWEQLQETAVTVQQRQQSCSQPNNINK